ncbi:MaoC family dehydratase [Paraburkholderia tagetis]|uniref:MaoC family dehydratase n=1 Tax=Paraburkholderia tagetis TaxID=2913261 RepID=A0A9X1RU86_9BURK|nr:MaoC family dehydratase [Paraburkholderia tagetis]MCG5076167.1 MaoC family dehydratase [Paraburkholderia tagetis]
MKVYETPDALKPLKGETIGTSDWLLIDQARVNLFADATDDHQWIHVDVERAKSGPFGTPIAHGFLTLSLMPGLIASAFEVRGTSAGVNYGLDKVRFPAPVRVGNRIRGRFRLLEWDAIGNGAVHAVQVKIEMTIEREGATKPACVAEPILRFFR